MCVVCVRECACDGTNSGNGSQTNKERLTEAADSRQRAKLKRGDAEHEGGRKGHGRVLPARPEDCALRALCAVRSSFGSGFSRSRLDGWWWWGRGRDEGSLACVSVCVYVCV